jgi:outer membrane protein
VHLLRNDNFSLDVLSRFRFNRLDPGSNPELQGLNKRSQSVDAGFVAGVRGRFGELQLTGVTDVLSKSNGSEVDLTYRVPFKVGNWGWSPYFSYFWQDEKLTNYYYGVSPGEATPERPAYAPGEAYSFAYGLNASYHVTAQFFALANVAFETIDDTVANSPIVSTCRLRRRRAGSGLMWTRASPLRRGASYSTHCS